MNPAGNRLISPGDPGGADDGGGGGDGGVGVRLPATVGWVWRLILCCILYFESMVLYVG